MKFIRYFFIVIASVIVLLILILLGGYLYLSKIETSVKDPIVSYSHFYDNEPVQKITDSVSKFHKGWIRTNPYGLYEMYVEGDAYERGTQIGKLTQPLINFQEDKLINKYNELLDTRRCSPLAENLIKLIANKVAPKINTEYKEELYGISQVSLDTFCETNSNFSRFVAYQTLHDLGHSFPNFVKLGCTSFSVKNKYTENGALMVGRTFDFWLSDPLAEKKIVSFINPSTGYKFITLSWPMLIGIVSGMNEKGLTITINTANSKIPREFGTPVAIVAREILQYAQNIEEAVAIAAQKSIFINESFMISSSQDHKSVLIEKTSKKMAVYDNYNDLIIATNHFQGNKMKMDDLNKEYIQSSASIYRQRRVEQVVKNIDTVMTPAKMVAVLRNDKGLNNANIGLGNEMCINQLNTHHSVVFLPDSLQMWVSSNPYQFGEYVCYDLKEIFAHASDSLSKLSPSTVATVSKNIPADPFVYSEAYCEYTYFLNTKKQIQAQTLQTLDVKKFTHANSEFFETYELMGDFYLYKKDYKNARMMFEKALKKEIPTRYNQNKILSKIAQCKES